MSLVIIYGPTAAGKLAVAKELAALTGYTLFDNHVIIDAIATLFPFEDSSLNMIRMALSRKYHLEMTEEAAKAGVNFITTLIIGSSDSFDFIHESKAVVERHGGNVYIVQLKPTLEAVMNRVESESRQGVKVASREHLKKFLQDKPMQFDTFPDIPHLVIDNSNLQPKEVALNICDFYSLGIKQSSRS